MTTPTTRERELAASVNLGAGSWTDEIAQLLARYRDEVLHGYGPLQCNQGAYRSPVGRAYCFDCGACPPDCWEAT